MIVFTMAGLSKRFRDAGYEKPKYQLQLWDGYVFDYAVASFTSFFETTQFLFIYRETGNSRSFIEQRATNLGIKNFKLTELPRETAGQAETVELGTNIAQVDEETPLTIFNIDTFRRPNLEINYNQKKLQGWLEVFEGEGSNWSFVKEDKEKRNIVAETTEKIPISNLCSNGLYYFATKTLFNEALQAERNKPSSTELYIAPIYNHLINSGKKIGFSKIKQNDLIFCGIPSEYEILTDKRIPWKTKK